MLNILYYYSLKKSFTFLNIYIIFNFVSIFMYIFRLTDKIKYYIKEGGFQRGNVIFATSPRSKDSTVATECEYLCDNI